MQSSVNLSVSSVVKIRLPIRPCYAEALREGKEPNSFATDVTDKIHQPAPDVSGFGLAGTENSLR